MSAIMEVYSPSGELLYSNKRFKAMRAARVIEARTHTLVPSNGSKTWDLTLGFDLPAFADRTLIAIAGGLLGGISVGGNQPQTLNISRRWRYENAQTEATVKKRYAPYIYVMEY